MSTNKIRRTSEAFARRIKMGKIGFYAIVEGRTSDRAFYDRLLRQNADLFPSGYSIRLAEEITLAGQSAGGKPFAYRLYSSFEENGWLFQRNNQNAQRVAFLLDRDYEHLTGTAKNSPHIIYTAAADTEAEIVLHGRMLDAIGSAYSLTFDQVRRAVPQDSLMSELSVLWRAWITLLVVAGSFHISIPHVHHAGLSKVNDGQFGQEIPSEVARFKSQLEAAITEPSPEELMAAKIAQVDAVYEAGLGAHLVKGKWIAAFIHHRICTRLADQFIQSNINPSSVFAVALATVDFNGDWTRHYREKLLQLMN